MPDQPSQPAASPAHDAGDSRSVRETDPAPCNCDAAADPPTGHRPWCGTEPAHDAGETADAAPMFTRVTCIVLACGGCGSKFDEHNGSEWEGVVHFATETEAIQTATDDDRWVVTGASAKCPDCVAKAECALTGHDFRRWDDSPAAWQDALAPDGSYVGRGRHCRRCHGIEFDPPHPDHALAIRSDGGSG